MSSKGDTLVVLLGNRMPEPDDIWSEVATESRRVIDQLDVHHVRLPGDSIHEAAWLEFTDLNGIACTLDVSTVHLDAVQEWPRAWFLSWFFQFTRAGGVVRLYDRTHGRSLLDFMLHDAGGVLIVNDGRQQDWEPPLIERAHELDIPVIWLRAGPPVSTVRIRRPQGRKADEPAQ